MTTDILQIQIRMRIQMLQHKLQTIACVPNDLNNNNNKIETSMLIEGRKYVAKLSSQIKIKSHRYVAIPPFSFKNRSVK